MARAVEADETRHVDASELVSKPCWRARRWSSCADRVASARRRWRPPSAWRRRPSRVAGSSWSPSTRPAALPTRSGVGKLGNVATRVPDRTLRSIGITPRGRAVGGNARHQGRLGRADPPARTRPPHSGLRAHQPAVPEHHQPLRAQSRLSRHGAAPRGPLVRSLRPRCRRHAAVAQRPRRPRRAVANGRLLRQPVAPLADGAHTGRGCSTWHHGRSTRSPTACSALASCRTSPSSSSSSRRWRAASCAGLGRSRRCSETRARRSSSSRRWRRRPPTKRATWSAS